MDSARFETLRVYLFTGCLEDVEEMDGRMYVIDDDGWMDGWMDELGNEFDLLSPGVLFGTSR